MKRIRIGTFAGIPASVQTRRFLERIYRFYPALRMPGAIETVEFMPDVTMQGDTPACMQSQAMEKALLSRDIDMIVRTADNRGIYSDGNQFATACYLPREAPWDCIYSDGKFQTFKSVGKNARIAAYDRRSAAFLTAIRPDLNITVVPSDKDLCPDTVIKHNYDCIMLPLSLFRNSGYEKEPVIVLDNGETVPAAGSGAVCADILRGNGQFAELLEKITDVFTEKTFGAETACVSQVLAASGYIIAGHAFFTDKDNICLRAAAVKSDGSRVISEIFSGDSAENAEIGKRAGAFLAAEICRQ